MKIIAKNLLRKIREQKPEPNSERLQKALSRSGIPDRIPSMELFADGEVMAAILEKPLNYFNRKIQSRREWEERVLSIIEFYETLGYDYVPALPWLVETSPSEMMREMGFSGTLDIALELSRGERFWAPEDTGLIANWDDFKTYKWEDPETTAEEWRVKLEWICDHTPSGMGVVTGACSVLEPVMWLMGIKNFYVSLYKQPDLVDAMFRKVAELNITRFELMAKINGKILAFWGSDDWGYNSGPMISPAMMRKWVFPVHKKTAEIAHEKGSLYILHSCGNLRIIMDDIIDNVKVDAKHSFEDGGLSVTEAKKLYGSRIGLIGGVDMDFLCRRSTEEIREHVSYILKVCKPGGGYCLGSGNSIANYVPLENYLIMLDVGLEKGWYS